MRKSVFILAFLLSMGMLYAQSNDYGIVEGDILVLGEANGSVYKHIDFPRKNIIIKRGAIANFNALVGQRLVVDELKTEKNGATIAVLKRKDGQKFFRFFPEVQAKLEPAVASGELKTLNYKGQGAIAQK